MDKIREQLRNPMITAAVGLIIGLIIGLPILGWSVWPVKWVDAEPRFLREDVKQQYLCMMVDSYLVRQDAATAITRFNSLGEDASAQLDAFKPGTCNLNEAEINAFRAVVLGPSVPAPVTTVTPVETPQPAAVKNIGLVFGKRGVATGQSPTGEAKEYTRQASRTDYAAQGQEPPIAQFMTTYMLGDDLYDDSFSIDSPTGEFLGECGVGISDTIGVGDPKKVTAFEVWLFDKNDIQTITKVVMSPHAIHDGAIRARLESKGEPIEVAPDRHVLLETATLVLEARVVDLNLGGGALPENSYFDRLTLELAVWPKTNA